MGRVLETLWDLLGLAPAPKEPAPPRNQKLKPAPKRRPGPTVAPSLALNRAPNRAPTRAAPIAEAKPKSAPAARKPAASPPASPARTKTAATATTSTTTNATPSPASMQDKYDAMVETKLREYGVRVRKWRTSMSGIAWQVEYKDGRIVRLIESPRPKGPMSAAVFLHEIGHHAIGFNVYKPRCLEEYHAWAYAIREMEAMGLNVTESVRKRMHQSLKYAVDKARRRGLKMLPVELEPYLRPYDPPVGTTGRP